MLFVLALVAVLASRLPELGERPMHTDEAVQAMIYLDPMLQGQAYTYSGADGHGPVLVQSTRLLCALTGTHTIVQATERLLRLTPALYGVALLLLLPLMGKGLGRSATAWTALFMAFSPMLAFYSRYYIMEVPLVFFTLAGIAAGWRYSATKNIGWMLVVGACAGAMHATKETFVIQVIAAVLAVIGVNALEYITAGTGMGPVTRRTKSDGHIIHYVAAVLVAGAVSFTLYSDFFRVPGQFFDSFKAYAQYAQRAEGAGHEKPFFWYLGLLFGRRDSDGFFCGEWPLLALAAVGMVKALLVPPKRYENTRLQRFFALYTPALLIGYSLIAYKTPWTILGAEQGVLVLAGIGAATLLSLPLGKFYRVFMGLALTVASAWLGGQVWRQNFVAPADPGRNPWVYSHTSPDIFRLVAKVRESAATRPDPKDFTVFTVHPEAGWPLPWYFRAYGGGATSVMPEDGELLLASDVVIMEPDTAALLGALVTSTHRLLKETYELRPGVNVRALFRKNLLADLPPDPKASKAGEKPAPATQNVSEPLSEKGVTSPAPPEPSPAAPPPGPPGLQPVPPPPASPTGTLNPAQP